MIISQNIVPPDIHLYCLLKDQATYLFVLSSISTLSLVLEQEDHQYLPDFFFNFNQTLWGGVLQTTFWLNRLWTPVPYLQNVNLCTSCCVHVSKILLIGHVVVCAGGERESVRNVGGGERYPLSYWLYWIARSHLLVSVCPPLPCPPSCFSTGLAEASGRIMMPPLSAPPLGGALSLPWLARPRGRGGEGGGAEQRKLPHILSDDISCFPERPWEIDPDTV